MSSHTEHASEGVIDAGLTGSGGYETRSPGAYDETLVLFPADVTGCLTESQPPRWPVLEALLAPKTAATVLDGLSEEGIQAAIPVHLSIAPRPAFSPKPVLAPTVSMGNIPR